jgi:two-component system cell cycle sensor histidine kinase/response regulator CckA
MKAVAQRRTSDVAQRLAEAEAVIEALLSGQIDAVVDSRSRTPVLLSKAQDALRESEERYRRIVETTNEGIWTHDTESKITFVNERLSEMLGYRADEMVGTSVFQLAPEVAQADAAMSGGRSRRETSEEREVGFLRKDGTRLWALLKTSPIRDTGGACVGTLAMITDWTRHKHAEEALRKSEEQYREIVETATDGILKIDDAAVILFVNGRFAEMLGHEPREMIGMSMLAFLNAEARVVAAPASRRGPRIKDAFDTTFRHKDGTEMSVNLLSTPLVDVAGQQAGHLVVVRDVTERNKLQSQLMVSDRMASLGTLSAGVAHEINNPLAAVIGNLDFIADGLEGKITGDSTSPGPGGESVRFLREIKASLDDAREAAGRVQFIVRDLKMFSRSPGDESSGPVDVKSVMESSLRMAWNEIRHRGRLVKGYGHVPCVEGNEARLGQVFLNLLVNAAQALPEGDAEHNEIRVTTRLDGPRVVVEVTDTGAGIAPELIGRIFDAFYTTKAVGVGTGLGLAICQRIVTDMGGELTVRSEVARGTTFRVSLPVAHARESEPAVPVTPVRVAGRRGRILVVDDEQAVVTAVRRILSDEHDVVAVVTAREALALCARGETFDLILSDLMMPEMTGMDLHRELSRVAPDQAERMIFLTGGAFTPKARRFLSESTREHLEKPFDSTHLRASVRRHLR